MHQRRRQEIQGRNQSHPSQRQQKTSQMYSDTFLRSVLCLICNSCYHCSFISHVILIFIISINFLCSRLKQVRRFSLQRSVAQQVVGSHSLTCLSSVKYGHSPAGSISSMPPVSTCSDARPRRTQRHSHHRNSDESCEFNDQFRRGCEGVQDSEHQEDESVLRVALKRAMENSGSMEWNHHHKDIKRFFESFSLMSGSMVNFVHDERDRKYLVTSEAEWTMLERQKIWQPH